MRLLVLLAWLCSGIALAAYDDVFKHPSVSQFHHGAFHDVSGNVRERIHSFLHSRAQLPFQVPLEVNVVLVGFNGDGGYRYTLDADKLKDVLNRTLPSHRPSCLETGMPLDIEHQLYYNVIPVGQIELISLEYTLKESLKSAGTARETEFGRELPLYEIEAMEVEPFFDRFYHYLFGTEANSEAEPNQPVPSAIFILNLDKARMHPNRTNGNITDDLTGKITDLSPDELKEQEAGYIYRYRYNGSATSQVWLSAGRYAVIDLSAGPCAYGKIDSEEGSIGYRTIPRMQNLHFLRGRVPVTGAKTDEIFSGQLAALVGSAIEHLISPDVRYETVDVAQRLLVSVIVLRNHNQYSLLHSGRNDSIDMKDIEKQVKRMVQPGQEVVVVGGVHNLHDHEKLAIAVRRALRSLSTHGTNKDGRYHPQIKTYIDGSVLREEFKQSAEALAAGLLELADSSLSSKFFYSKDWEDEDIVPVKHGIVKSSPVGAKKYATEDVKKERRLELRLRKAPLVRKSYGTRIVPVYVLSLAGMDEELLMQGESAVWTSKEAVFVIQHDSKPIPLSYVSETQRREAVPASPHRHIIAGLASVVGGLVSPYERASPVHDRPMVNWLWATGHHPFGPFSNAQGISQMLIDTSLRNSIYSRVDKSLQSIRTSLERIEAFSSDFLQTPLGEAVSLKKKRSATDAWLEKFIKKSTNLPRPISDEMVEQLKTYLDDLEGQLVQLSSLLYDHRFQDAHQNSSNLLLHATFAQQYVDYILEAEQEKLRCCKGVILVAGLIVYVAVIFLASSSGRD